MGLLDDLKNQADSKKAEQQAEAERQAKAEQFYREKILPRMVKAYQYINQFIDHLKVIDHETIVEYPILPQGKKQPFLQGGYMVVIDSSKNLKKIDFSMECTLEAPVQFELYGKEVVLSHADRISQYSIKHDRKDRKGPSMEIESAKFIVTGPLPLRVSLVADVAAGNIKLSIRNFIDPGFQHYTLKLEQFNDKFLDRLGRFVLRQDMNLFGKMEISEEQKKKIRDRMLVEQKLRQEELQQAEERARAEAEEEAANTKKEQLKRAVNTTVSQGKENLKGMFNKIKQTASQIAESQLKAQERKPPEQAAPVEQQLAQQKPAASQPVQSVSSNATNPNATNQAQVKPKAPAAGQTPVATQAASTRAPAKPNQAAPAKKPAPQVNKTASPEQKASLQAKLATQLKATTQQAPKPAAKQPENSPQAEAKRPAAPVKKSEPPRVFQASSDNPFLTPEDMLTPEQIKEQAEKERKLKEQTRAEMIAEKARANVEAEQATSSQPDSQKNPQQNPQQNNLNAQPQDKNPAGKTGQAPVNQKPEVRQQTAIEPGSSLSLEPQGKTKEQAAPNKTPVSNTKKVESASAGPKSPVRQEKPEPETAQKPELKPVDKRQEAKPAKEEKKGNGLSLSLEEPADSTAAKPVASEKAEAQKTPDAVDDVLQKGTGLSLEGEPEKSKPEKSKSEKPEPKISEPEKVKPEKVKPEKVKPEKVKSEKIKSEKIKSEQPKPDTSSNTTEPVGLAPELDADGLPLASPDDVMDFDLNDLSTLSDAEQAESEQDEAEQKSETSSSDVEVKPKVPPDTTSAGSNSTGSLKDAWQKSKTKSEPELEKEDKKTDQQEQVNLEPVALASEVAPVDAQMPVEESSSESVHDSVDSTSQEQEEQDVAMPTPAAETKTETPVSDKEITAESAVADVAKVDPELSPEVVAESSTPADVKPEASAKDVEPQAKPVVEAKAVSEPAPEVDIKPATPADDEPEAPAKVVKQQSEPVVESKAVSEPTELTLEDELARDLANIIETEQQNKTAQSTDESETPDEKLKIDLTAPEALEIDFDNTGGASGSEPPEKDPDTNK